MKIFNKTIIFPHIILLIEGRLLMLLAVWFLCFIIYGLPEAAAEGPIYIVIAIAFIPLSLWAVYHFWPLCFGELVVTETYVKWRCLFMRSCKLEFSEIKYMEIRAMGKEKVMKYDVYNSGYEYLLISTEPLPNKIIEKIRTSRKLIKFQVTPRICRQLAEAMPEKYKSMFSWRANRAGLIWGKRKKKKK